MVGVEHWLMARWKARVEYLLNVIVLLFYLLRLRSYKAKCQKLAAFRRGRSLGAKISGERVAPVNILIPLERQLIALQLCR